MKPAKKSPAGTKSTTKTPVTKATTTKTPASKTPTKIQAKRPAAQTDDDKRLAKNAALRAWRSAHAEEQRAYMAEWRAKQKATTATNTPTSRTDAKPVTSPNSEKGGGA
jgi:hypothetical protein